MFSNRERFWGRYQIPIDQFNKQYCWPPTYIKCIKCDCSELAKHKTYMKNGHSYDTYIWECPSCQSQYRLVNGTTHFENITEE
ncbi:hypothetical protein DSH57_12070 [Enterococcus faecium]|nr:hypothetical protein [Enterococcus faecium]EGP5343798.1 hypothetical protein [Enterococcus faecium]EGP5672307.1 hypothetical protein [Enterococcus faecium]EGP5699552.1 hypothetical protein [Enterococcus faecium]